MTPAELEKIIAAARCRVIGWQDITNGGHRLVLARLVQAFDNSESHLLCEPSLCRRTTRPPDIVLIDPEVGVHVVEVKGIQMSQIESLQAGGLMGIRYDTRINNRNPIKQVRDAMFDIKHATIRAYGAEVGIPFRYWVAFPHFSREQWMSRFGEDAFCPPEFIFEREMERAELLLKLGATDRTIPSPEPVTTCSLEQLQCVWKAFGDTSVLYWKPEDRPPRRIEEGTLGEAFDEKAEAWKALSKEQEELSTTHWESGPRLVRGVAGSGKTIVLANNLARRLQRLLRAEGNLFDAAPRPPRCLAVCFNRTLAPFLRKKIDLAFEQRTGRAIPAGSLDVFAMNTLMYDLGRKGLWKYQPVEKNDEQRRAKQYLSELQGLKQSNPPLLERNQYDAIYVDEGQDFLEPEFILLKELCRQPAEPNLYVFYDDAQNLYGRPRPNWQSMGLNVRGGRTSIMTECFRNTRQIVEAGFNVLYGMTSDAPGKVPTRNFGDVATLREKQLITEENGLFRIHFARREGRAPIVTWAADRKAENDLLLARLSVLIREQSVRPEDILVLSFLRRRVEELADLIQKAQIPGIEAVHCAIAQKEQPLTQRGRLSVSTVASAKGYDAYVVLLASANDFSLDVKGRASFYVACTRAMEYLEIFAHQRRGLPLEMEAAVRTLNKP